jgi:hypothetical protein
MVCYIYISMRRELLGECLAYNIAVMSAYYLSVA